MCKANEKVSIINIYLLVMFILFCVNPSFAQSESHLKFMGVELTGTLQEYSNQFEKLHPDFSCYEKSDTAYRYKGNFFKFKDCNISAFARAKYNNIVTRGCVFIEKTYLYADELKELFSNLNDKYGHYRVLEKIDNDILKLRWTSENGIIELELYNLGVNFCTINYFDKTESNDIIQEEKKSQQKLIDDL